MEEKKIIIITPVSRIKNLEIIKNSINFNFIFKWIIVYDGNKIKKDFQYFKKNNQIEEFMYLSKSNEVLGNGQRNFALEYINKKYSNDDIFVYFLDDDNVIHPNFYNLVDRFKKNYLYTFDQQRTRYILSGIKPKLYFIDLAMFVSDFKIIRDIRFVCETYNADGTYIEDCYKKNINNHLYIEETACYYNYLKRNIFRRAYYRVYWFLLIFFLKLTGKQIKKQFKP
tara:strand:- start:484 stop:1161 length:678 start_codon:yes stop_codon:yes gene_type:complete